MPVRFQDATFIGSRHPGVTTTLFFCRYSLVDGLMVHPQLLRCYREIKKEHLIHCRMNDFDVFFIKSNFSANLQKTIHRLISACYWAQSGITPVPDGAVTVQLSTPRVSAQA